MLDAIQILIPFLGTDNRLSRSSTANSLPGEQIQLLLLQPQPFELLLRKEQTQRPRPLQEVLVLLRSTYLSLRIYTKDIPQRK